MQIQVILLERVEKLGKLGDVVKVKGGYARNFLIPQKKAMRATAENIKQYEAMATDMASNNAALREEAEKIQAKMEGTVVTLIRQAGENKHLYGSVKTRDIAEALAVHGFTVSRAQIFLASPIKELGIFESRVALHPEVTQIVQVNVALSVEEAKGAYEAYQKAKNAPKTKKEKVEKAIAQAIAEEATEAADAASAEEAVAE